MLLEHLTGEKLNAEKLTLPRIVVGLVGDCGVLRATLKHMLRCDNIGIFERQTCDPSRGIIIPAPGSMGSGDQPSGVGGPAVMRVRASRRRRLL
jgi:hypothetical protein